MGKELKWISNSSYSFDGEVSDNLSNSSPNDLVIKFSKDYTIIKAEKNLWFCFSDVEGELKWLDTHSYEVNNTRHDNLNGDTPTSLLLKFKKKNDFIKSGPNTWRCVSVGESSAGRVESLDGIVVIHDTLVAHPQNLPELDAPSTIQSNAVTRFSPSNTHTSFDTFISNFQQTEDELKYIFLLPERYQMRIWYHDSRSANFKRVRNVNTGWTDVSEFLKPGGVFTENMANTDYNIRFEIFKNNKTVRYTSSHRPNQLPLPIINITGIYECHFRSKSNLNSKV